MANPDGAKRAQVAERRRRATELILAGHTYDQVATELKDLGYKDRSHVFNDLKNARKQANRDVVQNLEEMRELTNARYERLLSGHWPAALAGDEKAAKVVLQILAQQATLNGTNAPKDLRIQLERRNEMEASLVTEAVLAAFDAAGIPPELRMIALEAASQRLAQVDDMGQSVIAGEIVESGDQDQ